MTVGLILVAHGARDPRWAEPFEQLRERVVRASPSTPVALAYLEIMAPDVAAAAAALCDAGCRAITVVPLFLGQGSHVRKDLPLQLQRAADRHPECDFRLAGAAGEVESVLDAMAAYCVSRVVA